MTDRALHGLLERRWILPLVVLFVDAALLAGAVAFGLRIPSFHRLDSLPAGTNLDYGSRLTSVSALREGFVTDVLGPDEGRSPRPGVSGQGDHQSPPETSGVPKALSGITADPPTHPATNDDFEDAREVASVPYEARTTTNESERQSDEPSSCGPVGGTLWYRFTSQEDIGLIADTFGSDHPTILGVYKGPSLGQLTEIGCHRDVRGLALVAFAAHAAETYYFQIGAPSRLVNSLLGKGNLVFRLSAQGITSLASVGESGPPDGPSEYPRVSADGRHVAFRSGAGNLDTRYPGTVCAHGSVCGQIFVRDVARGRTALVSMSSTGEPGDLQSGHGFGLYQPALSADGRYVAFTSLATNLVEGDTNICPSAQGPAYTIAGPPGSCPDVFVHDRDADRDGILDEDPRIEPGAVSTTRVSVASSGAQADGASGTPSISADGRYIAFSSWASNLIAGDTQMCAANAEFLTADYNCADAFVHDRLTGETFRVSLTPAGDGGNGDSATSLGSLGADAAISANGRQVAFTSSASDLVPGDGNGQLDVFVRDLVSDRTTRISVSSSGAEAHGPSGGKVAISATGRYVAFSSKASDLVHRDANEVGDIFVHDRDTDRDGVFDEPGATSTVLASVSSSGQQARQGSSVPALSAAGRYVAFLSAAPNLVPDDTNGDSSDLNIGVDVFRRDLRRGVTVRTSVSSDGKQAAMGGAAFPASMGMSADGRVLTWDSESGDLTEEDQHPSWDVFIRRVMWRPT